MFNSIKLLSVMLVLTTVFVLSSATVVSADIEFDSVSSAGQGGVELSWQHAVGNGDNRILVVGIAAEDGSASQLVIDSVTYGAAEMTQVAGSELITGSYFLKTELYYLLSPAIGTDTITITYNGWITSISAGAVSLFNVAQQPAEAVVTNWVNATNTISTQVTVQTEGAVVIDIVGSDTAESFTATDTDMTEQFDVLTGTASAAGGTILDAPDAPVTMSWRHSDATVLNHSVAVFAGIVQPQKASGANPVKGSTDAPPYSVLSWAPGLGASSHDVYFGTDFDDVNEADNTLPVGTSAYKGNQPFDANVYDPCFLESEQIYYWRIDEVINADPLSPYKGNIWNFTVQEYLEGDFTDDDSVNKDDLELLAAQWLNTGVALEADTDFNGKVDFRDYMILANKWLFVTEPPPNECENWQVLHPEWLFCDDFESGPNLNARYHDVSTNGMFVSTNDVFGGSHCLEQTYTPGQVNAGWVTRYIGDNPHLGSPGAKINEIYYRFYHKFENGFTGLPPKMARTKVYRTAGDWSGALGIYQWIGGSGYLVADKRTYIYSSGTYQWLPVRQSTLDYGDPANIGRWICIEVRIRLDAPGANDGVIQYWVDGEQALYETGLALGNESYAKGLNMVMLDCYWNGGSPAAQSRYYDNFVISTAPIGPRPW